MGERRAVQDAALVDVLTRPAGVVVVGASADPAKSSSRSLTYLQRYGYAGRVQVVNPRHREIAGFPCVPEIAAVDPHDADAAIVNLGAERVTDALRALDRVGVRAAVVIGSGFEDRIDRARQALEAFLAEPGRRLRVIGPNCVGTMSVASGAHLNFSSVLQTVSPRASGIALVTQSGATGNGLLMSLLRRGIGVAHWMSSGDELDVGALELIAGLLVRDDVACVGLFLEAITDVAWLPRVRELMRATGKPVYVVKIADSDLGQLAAGGHTGRVVGSSDISRAVLAQAGFVRMPSLDALADCLVVSETVGRLPQPAQLAAVSVSGASGVVLADEVRASRSLRMASWPPAMADLVTTLGRGRLHLANPLDVPFLGETETFAGLVAAASQDAGADVVVAVESSLAHRRDTLADALLARPETAAPVVLTHLSEDDPIDSDLVAKLADARVAVVPTPERAIRAVAAVCDRGEPAEGIGVAPPPKADAGLAAGLDAVAAALPADFPWAPWRTVATEAQAAQAGADLGFPVAIKAAGRTIAHRSELGAVRVVRDAAALPEAWRQVAAVCAEHGDEVIVQRGAPAGQDVLLAVVRDVEYGPAAIVRPGGVLAELLDEQVVLWPGWGADDRAATLRASRLGRLLSGYRNSAAVDVAGLLGVVEAILATFAGTPFAFVEFNPVVVTGTGAVVVDALATLLRPLGAAALTPPHHPDKEPQ